MIDNNIKIKALNDYIQDIKPYHTKIFGTSSEINFSDSLNLTFFDDQFQSTLIQKQIWNYLDLPSLSQISDGSANSQRYILPATIFSRSSITDQTSQYPIGDDQATIDLTDTDANGVPNSDYPWVGSASLSHQMGSDIIPFQIIINDLNVTVLSAALISASQINYSISLTGIIDVAKMNSFGVPTNALELLHNGITNIVDASSGTFTTSFTSSFDPSAFMNSEPSIGISINQLVISYVYRDAPRLMAIIDTGRYEVSFHHASRIHVNNNLKIFGPTNDYVVDQTRSFIQFLSGKHPASIDQIAINLMNSDRLYVSNTSPLKIGIDFWTMTISDNFPNRNNLVFYNSQSGLIKPNIDNIMIYPSQTNGNVWSFVADGFFSVKVQQTQPALGPIETAIINEPFDNGKIAFTLVPSWNDYYLTHGATGYGAYDIPIRLDRSDYWPNSTGNLDTPMFNSIGQLLIETSGTDKYYIFQLSSIPARGNYIEIKVEQSKQFNPRAEISMNEHLRIIQIGNIIGGFDICNFGMSPIESDTATVVDILNLFSNDPKYQNYNLDNVVCGI